MSEIRVDKIQAYQDSFSVTIAGITTFSGTGCVSMPGGTSTQRPEVSKKGQIRYINGDVKKGLEYYNGTEWVTVGVANGSVPEGTTPIGVFGGGEGDNVIDYIAITSLGNATSFGILTSRKTWVSSCSSSTRGVFGGGRSVVPGAYVNAIDYITIATTGNAQTFGQLTQSRYVTASCSSSTRGVFGGGSGNSPVGFVNTIDYITIATTGNAQTFGVLTAKKYGLAACSSSTRGVFGGGYQDVPVSANINVIEYITIASSGVDAQDFGDLTYTGTYISSCSSSTRGVFGGGLSPTNTNTIDYITIASQGTPATTFGQLTQARRGLAACSSSTRGVFGGGYTPTAVNTIDYITIATTSSANDFGDLTQSRHGLGALSNNHGGLLAS